jgi:hypothetical protein
VWLEIDFEVAETPEAVEEEAEAETRLSA